MLMGALIGGCIGIVVALLSLLFRKARLCPECGEKLPMPWIRPLRECPHCGEDLKGGPAVPAASRTSGSPVLVVSILLLVLGAGLFVVMLPSALESRRVWKHQERQVAVRENELRELEGKGDAASRAQADKLRADLRSWNPEGHRESSVERTVTAGIGGVLAAAGLTLLILRLVARRALRDRYDEDDDDRDDED